MSTEILLPKGRIVAGNPMDWLPVKDDKGANKLDKNGNVLHSNWIYLAIPKQDFINVVWPVLVAEAMKVYRNAANIHPDNYENDGFAWKIINGDSPYPPKKKPNSEPYNKREGYPGCYVIKLTTYAFLPDTVVFQNGAYRKLEKGQVKCGDYIVTKAEIDTRSDNNGMGMYWNPVIYELVEIGTYIAGSEGGRDPNQALGDASTRTHQGFQGVLPTAGAPAIHQPAAQQGVPPLPQSGMPGAMQGAPMMAQPAPSYAPAPVPVNPAYAPAMPPVMPQNPAPIMAQGGYAPAQGSPVMASPSNPTQPIAQHDYPAPAMDFVNNAVGQPGGAHPQSSMPNAVPAMPMQQPMMQSGVHGAGVVTTSPSNPMGMPQFPQR